MKRITLAMSVLLRASGLWAQTTASAPAETSSAERGFTLDDALAAMRRAHPLLSSGRATVRAAGSDVVGAGLWSNPVLQVNYTRSLGFTTYDPRLGLPQVGVSQLLETSGLPTARRRAAELQQDASRDDLRAAEVGLGFDVVAAAIDLARAQRIVDIFRDAQRDLESASVVVQARVGAGAAPRFDASRMTLALADARADTQDAEADLVRARTSLDVAVGPEADALRGALRLDVEAVPGLQALDALTAAMESRPDLHAARVRAGAASAAIEVARRSVVQGVSVYAGSIVGAGAGNHDEVQVDLALGLSVPLAVVDRGQGSIPAAERRAEAARFNADAVLLAARQRLAGAWREVEQRRRAEASYEVTETVEAREMRHEAEVGYREGRLSILEMVDAYGAFRSARLRVVTLAGDARQAEVILGRAAGVSAITPR